jgi:DNA-directed RNA polymerase subunit RPC12/RpoP
MSGGFVTRNCPACNKSNTLSEADFKKLGLWIACPQCKRRMAAEILPDKNYGYVCSHCDLGIPLFALLPKYDDI